MGPQKSQYRETPKQQATYTQPKRTQPGWLSSSLYRPDWQEWRHSVSQWCLSSQHDTHIHTHLRTSNPGNTKPQASNNQKKTKKQNKKNLPSGRNLQVSPTQMANTSRDQLDIVNNRYGPGDCPISGGSHYLIQAYPVAKQEYRH